MRNPLLSLRWREASRSWARPTVICIAPGCRPHGQLVTTHPAWSHTTRRPGCRWKPPRSYGNGECSPAPPDGVRCIFPAKDIEADVLAEQISACQRTEGGDEDL
jgi:hypothetical protein